METYRSLVPQSEDVGSSSDGKGTHTMSTHHVGPAHAGGCGDHRPSKVPQQRFLRDPVSIALVTVIVLTLSAAALLASELYARHRAGSVLAKVVECEVKDQTSVSFGVRPVLLELMTGKFSDISIETGGNRIREAIGMKMELQISDLRLHSNDQGTLGSADAQFTWSNEGIKQTLQDAIPIFGGLVTGVTTKPSDGAFELQGRLGSITTRPRIANGGLELQVLNVTGFGLTLPPNTVQPALDALTAAVTESLPMGIHPDKVQVNDRGMTLKFSARDANISLRQTDPCFADL